MITTILLSQEWPHKYGLVFNSTSELRSPLSIHPAFGGCLDWHSAVHGHWWDSLITFLEEYL